MPTAQISLPCLSAAITSYFTPVMAFNISMLMTTSYAISALRRDIASRRFQPATHSQG